MMNRAIIPTLLVLAFTVILVPMGRADVPPSDETAEAALADSPRHQEILKIEVPGLNTAIDSFLVFPERADKAPVVVVIHEIFGLTDWVKSIADELAAEGFIAIAPDMISDVPGDDANIAKVRGLPREAVNAKLDAARAHALGLPAASGTSATIGFCWGGSSSFEYAVHQPDLDAAVVYYGTSPATPQLKSINAAVQGHYGEMDARVNTTVPPAEEEMARLGKTFETYTYTNAGHGFLRAQAGRDGDNGKGAAQAWPATLKFLREHTGTGEATD